jgi:hypothetical protein
MGKPQIITGAIGGGGQPFAAVDPAATYCQSKVAEMRFAALLTPFKSQAEALAALAAAGADVEGGARD